ncbi:RAxF-45 family protein [Metabacillus lacus]|nr:RAxF-45 family protein [Metabacillus lacus]
MLNKAVLLCDFWIEFLYLNRAKFAVAVVNGISLPFLTTQ